MLWAQLSGKLRVPDDRSEDLLTSNVFGVLKYVPFELGLEPVLRSAAGSGTEGLERFLVAGTQASVEFWRWFESSSGNGCEPDVVLHLTSAAAERALIFVEVKYRSGKSSVADPITTPRQPRDQLAREWQSCLDTAGALEAVPFLLFLTVDDLYPAAEIEDSQLDLERCRLERGRILWTSWQRVTAALDRTCPMLRDLRRLLIERYGFLFDGLAVPETRLGWSLEAAHADEAVELDFATPLAWQLSQPGAHWNQWSKERLRWELTS